MVKMDPNEWKHEMNRMLESFANQAEISLGKINRCFETLGQPFDDVFRKYYLEMSNQRLDMSFKAVLFSKRRGNETENSTNHCSAIFNQKLNSLKNEHDGDLIEICGSDDEDHLDTRPDQNPDGVQHGPAIGHRNEAKPLVQFEPDRGIEGDSGATMIEIYDSDDDEQQLQTQAIIVANGSHIEKSKDTDPLLKHGIPNIIRDGTQFDPAVLGSENEVKPFVKVESNAAMAMEMVDIPLVQFNPREVNDTTVTVNGRSGNGAAQRMGPSPNRKGNQTKRDEGKRFECEHCDCVFKTKRQVQQHQTVHANGKLIGVKADSNGLYHCTLCVRRFFNVNHLSRHMKAHKNGQRLYYCARCMRKFDQKAKKERHESQCGSHHYECHLCKVYVTRMKDQMQNHMRKHSGAQPFHCMVCNKYFQHKAGVKRHLNRTHNQNRL